MLSLCIKKNKLMKKIVGKAALFLGAVSLTLSSCSDFDEINTNPNAANERPGTRGVFA